MIVICSGCGKLKAGKLIWLDCDINQDEAPEGYISHGICPDCVRKLYPPDIAEDVIAEARRRNKRAPDPDARPLS